VETITRIEECGITEIPFVKAMLLPKDTPHIECDSFEDIRKRIEKY
jgi:hypothetical protein